MVNAHAHRDLLEVGAKISANPVCTARIAAKRADAETERIVTRKTGHAHAHLVIRESFVMRNVILDSMGWVVLADVCVETLRSAIPVMVLARAPPVLQA